MNYDQYYKINKNVFGEKPEELLKKYSPQISMTDPILDIGAGQGRNTIYLSSLGYDVEAIDPSKTSIQILEEVKKKEKLSFEFFNTNFMKYNNNKKYSAILLFGLMQILDWEEIELLKIKIAEWLKEGSLLFITSFTTKDLSHKKIIEESINIGKNSYQKSNGEKRTFFELGEIKSMFDEYEVLHYWEGLGPEHHHGNSQIERHELIEAVFKFR